MEINKNEGSLSTHARVIESKEEDAFMMLCGSCQPGLESESFTTRDTLYPVSIRGAGIALVVFVTALLLVYGFYLRSPRWDKNFGVADNRHFFGPNTFYLDSCLKNGEYPVWNPLSYCGLPFSADGQASACYPFHLLRSLLTPGYDPYASAVGMQLLMVLHILWAGLGAFFLAQSYGLSIGASIVCGLAFMFSPYGIIHFSDYYVYALTSTWTSWILWATRRALRSVTIGQCVWNGIWAVFFFTMSTLGGFPQLSLYIGIMVSLFVMLDAFFNIPYKMSLNALKHAFNTLLFHAVFLIVLAIMTALGAAVLLLPEMQLGLLGARTSVGGLDMPQWPQNLHWFHLLKCLAVYPGNTWGPEGCRAVGIGSLLIIIAALSHFRRRGALVFMGLYLLMSDCTLGPPFPLGWLLRQMDFLNITASPWRAGDFSILALGMVAAFGIDAAGHMPRLLRWRIVQTVVLVVVGSGLFFLAGHWLTHLPRLQFYPSIVVWILPAMTFLFLCAFSWWNAPRFGRIVLALLLGCEIVAWSAQMLPNSVNRHRIANNADTARFGQTSTITLSNFRRAHVRPNRQMWFLDHAINGYNPLFLGSTSQVLCSPADDRNYFHRVHLKYKAVTEDNMRGNLFAKRCFWLTRNWVSGKLPDKNEGFPPTTTVFLPDVPSGKTLPVPELMRNQLTPSPVSSESIRQDLGKGAELANKIKKVAGNHTIQLPTIKPGFRHAALYIRYQATRSAPVSASCVDETGAYYALKKTTVEVARDNPGMFFLPLPDCDTCTISLSWPNQYKNDFHLEEVYAVTDSADENEHIVIEERTPNSVTIAIKALPEARILAFIDSYYPGWHAFLDGQEVEILRANDAFKAIIVPSGAHQVYFVYASKITRIGFITTMITFTLLLAVGLILFFRKVPYASFPSA